jgi:hypothetical protein
MFSPIRVVNWKGLETTGQAMKETKSVQADIFDMFLVQTRRGYVKYEKLAGRTSLI